MTITAAATDEVGRYLADVAARLDRLDPDERAELLSDLEQHLLEVAAEAGAPLHERLGPPDVYAAELLASVGFEPSPPPRTTMVARLVAAAGRVETTTAYRSTVTYLRTLRPAWWLLRGFLLAWLVGEFLALDSLRVSMLPFPAIGPNVVPGFLLTAAGVIGSVYVGRRTATGSWRGAVRLADVALVLFGLTLAGQLNSRLAGPMVVYAQDADRCLVNGNGAVIENLYPYDAEGRAIETVLLYDQYGRPLDNLCPSLPTDYVRDADGQMVVNAFPRRQHAHPFDESVTPPSVAPPSIVPPRLAPSTTTTTAPATTTTTTTTAPPSTP